MGKEKVFREIKKLGLNKIETFSPYDEREVTLGASRRGRSIHQLQYRIMLGALLVSLLRAMSH